jgi:hypothetical protein
MHLRMGWKHPNGENMGQLALSWTSRRAGYSQRSLACGGGRKQAIVPGAHLSHGLETGCLGERGNGRLSHCCETVPLDSGAVTNRNIAGWRKQP